MQSAGDIGAQQQPSNICVREIEIAPDLLLRALLQLDASRRVSILDSGGARAPEEARFLIAGFDPFEIVEARGNELRITTRRDTEAVERFVPEGDSIVALDERLKSYHTPPSSQFDVPAVGACIATFAYELAHRLDRLRIDTARHIITEPDAVLAFFDTLVIHDYVRGRSQIVSRSGPRRLDETFEAIKDAATRAALVWAGKANFSRQTVAEGDAAFSRLPRAVSGQSVKSNFTRDEYITAVERTKEHIAAGDIYQANLTQQIAVALDPDNTPENIFLRLRRDHPASFAAFIRRREDVVVSASPERFLRVEVEAGAGGGGGERRVEAWPIKGTRARGVSAADDERLRSELHESEKDRAENVMIVDLLRNDLGRVCRTGSIEVRELFTVQEHPTLFHLVSKVRGLLREDVGAGDLLRAAFPCGSITGAPKLRAMEIIDELESVPRGLSMGAIGYFSFDGRMDLSVAIRTMVIREGRARFNVGGGIVADSDPVLEYEESLTKAQALLRALGR
jgi:para-aminobenzoate synthetase component 1